MWGCDSTILGGSCGLLGAFWDSLGPGGSLEKVAWGLWGDSGIVLGNHGAVLGRCWGRLEALLGLLGAILGISWALLGAA